MRESRADAFGNSRNIQIERSVSFLIHFFIKFLKISFSLQKSYHFQQLINKIVKEELSNEIESDLELQDIILREILDNFEQWQEEQYAMELENDINVHESVVCPVCEFNALNLNENIISCSCGLRFVLRIYYDPSINFDPFLF
jgi:hypothetical protein